MRTIAALLTALVFLGCASASAREVYRFEMSNATLSLTDAPCEIDEIMSATPDAVKPLVRGGSVRFSAADGRPQRKLCWIHVDEDTVAVQDEAGNGAYFPAPRPKPRISI